MGLVQLAGFDVIRGTMCIPRIGAWHADLVVEDPGAGGLSGQVQLNVGNDLAFTGTAYRSGEFNEKTYVRFVAGAAGLAKVCTPKAYNNVGLGIPLNDILKGAGETPSTTIDAAVLQKQLVAWSTMAVPLGSALAELLLAGPANTAWRMLNDGTFWAGAETWPSSSVVYQLIDSDPDLGRVKIATDEPTLLPGVALDLGDVSYVEHHITPSRIRTIAWLESSVPTLDRVKSGWARFAGAVMQRVDRYGLFRARVVSQSGDLTKLDVVAADPRLPQQGFSKVPLRHGLPAIKVRITPGAFVLIGFMSGDAQQPYVHAWEGGETLQSLEVGSSADNVVTKQDLAAVIASLTAAKYSPGPGAPVAIDFSATPLPSAYASNVVKVQR